MDIHHTDFVECISYVTRMPYGKSREKAACQDWYMALMTTQIKLIKPISFAATRRNVLINGARGTVRHDQKWTLTTCHRNDTPGSRITPLNLSNLTPSLYQCNTLNRTGYYLLLERSHFKICGTIVDYTFFSFDHGTFGTPELVHSLKYAY